MQNEDIIKKWLTGSLSDSEKKEFEQTEDYKKINKLLKAVKSFKAPEYNVEKGYTSLLKQKRGKQKHVRLMDRFSPFLKVAAVVIFMLAFGYIFYVSNNSHENSTGEWYANQSGFYLPDSSFVLLNKGSKIKFSQNEWKNKRDVELQGEAFFKVKKGSRFRVKTEQGIVSVLGTEFNVKDWDKYYEVTCFTGLVKVQTEQMNVLLKPNASFRIVDGIEEQYQTSLGIEPDWIKGESNFKSVPYHFVVEELERQYDVSVIAKNINMDQAFTGSFPCNNLEVALKSVTIPVNVKYQVKGNKIEFSFKEDN